MFVELVIVHTLIDHRSDVKFFKTHYIISVEGGVRQYEHRKTEQKISINTAQNNIRKPQTAFKLP